MIHPKLVYSDIPKEYLFCKTIESTEDNPDAYAWVSLSLDESDNIDVIIDAWIYAENPVISQINFNKKFFLQELKDLLEDRFISNSSISYLIKFTWEKGDFSVGIPDGYNCSLIYNSSNEPVTRTWIWNNE